MRIYFSSPGNQLQASYVAHAPVLLSFATWKPWMEGYEQSFRPVLLDSGAFSVLNDDKPCGTCNACVEREVALCAKEETE